MPSSAYMGLGPTDGVTPGQQFMDDRDFELLVDRIEIEARARPGIYKAQLFGLAVFGYGFLAVVVAVPYFAAVSFPLARANEFEADEAAARLTSPQITSQALTTTSVVAAFLSECYWPEVLQAAVRAPPQTSFLPYSRLGAIALTGISEEDRKRWVTAALNWVASVTDTHPSLEERLHALGGTPEVAIATPGQAADLLLRPALSRVTAAFDKQWTGELALWRDRQLQRQKPQQEDFAPAPPR